MIDIYRDEKVRKIEKVNGIEDEYRYNKKLSKYVNKYCMKHGCSTEEALQHELIGNVYLMYMDV